jgi:uncharacterized protein
VNAIAPDTRRKRRTRRLFLGGLLAGMIAPPVWMRWLEPRWLGVDHQDIPLRVVGDGEPLRILHLSDFHASDVVPLEFIERAIRLGLSLEPDLICLTGDYVTTKFADLEGYSQALQLLSFAAPTFACLGNHDGGSWVRPRGGYDATDIVRRLLSGAQIAVLHNASAQVNIRGRRLQIIGLADHWTTEFNCEAAFTTPAEEGALRLVLSHNPDSKDVLADQPWNLMLCGHTHGGQCDLPFLGTPFAPVRDRRFVRGLHRWQDRWVYITKGVGNLHGMRLNCRPEVSLLTLS